MIRRPLRELGFQHINDEFRNMESHRETETFGSMNSTAHHTRLRNNVAWCREDVVARSPFRSARKTHQVSSDQSGLEILHQGRLYRSCVLRFPPTKAPRYIRHQPHHVYLSYELPPVDEQY